MRSVVPAMEKQDGPDCPHCGCNHSTVISDVRLFNGRPGTRRRCTHCGHVWSSVNRPAEVANAAIIIRRLECPRCGKADNEVETSRMVAGRRTRYHRCRACGWSFKTVEMSQ